MIFFHLSLKVFQYASSKLNSGLICEFTLLANFQLIKLKRDKKFLKNLKK